MKKNKLIKGYIQVGEDWLKDFAEIEAEQLRKYIQKELDKRIKKKLKKDMVKSFLCSEPVQPTLKGIA